MDSEYIRRRLSSVQIEHLVGNRIVFDFSPEIAKTSIVAANNELKAPIYITHDYMSVAWDIVCERYSLDQCYYSPFSFSWIGKHESIVVCLGLVIEHQLTDNRLHFAATNSMFVSATTKVSDFGF